ncbi:hypothetical protein PVAP13_1KG138015 [Panicum virgatum]|uniref:Uncharacterized protein n=1 Tax=Panicum virgatum TaxID=38727 RepID=A0A8T0X8E6_PANVG|nr:hypothetical protein PVAP13_1KG138015 [Panicum virgatum]
MACHLIPQAPSPAHPCPPTPSSPSLPVSLGGGGAAQSGCGKLAGGGEHAGAKRGKPRGRDLKASADRGRLGAGGRPWQQGSGGQARVRRPPGTRAKRPGAGGGSRPGRSGAAAKGPRAACNGCSVLRLGCGRGPGLVRAKDSSVFTVRGARKTSYKIKKSVS